MRIIREKIFNLLENNSDITSMLATESAIVNNVKTNRPCIYGNWRGHNQSLFPQIVVVCTSSVPDNDTMLSGYIHHERWHVQAWAKTRGSIHTDIMDAVLDLLHEKSYTLPEGYNWKFSHKVGGSYDDFDPASEEMFSTAIYEIAFSRS